MGSGDSDLIWHGLQAKSLLSALCQRKVEFVVLGSVARVLRGNRRPPPSDLDIAPEQSEGNLARLASCLNNLEVYGDWVPLVRQQVDVALFRGPGNAWPFRSYLGRIEICLRVGAVADTYADLQPNATAVSIDTDVVWIASLEDLDRYDAARGTG